MYAASTATFNTTRKPDALNSNVALPAAILPCSAATTDTVLIERCRRGDKSAWDQLIGRYSKTIYKLAYSFCHNMEDASDIAGHVFVQVYLKLNSFRAESSFSSWLYRIVRNTYLDMCVRPAHRSNVSLDASLSAGGDTAWADNIQDPSPSPEAICIESETALMLRKAVGFLPTYQRQMLQMYHIEGTTYVDIAAKTGLPVGTVKSRLNRARTMLRERLEPFQAQLTEA